MGKNLLRLVPILLIFTLPAAASDLLITAIDHGDPNAPFEGAPRPGETGTIYFKLKNTGKESLRDLILKGNPGKCVSELSPTLRIPELAVGQELRVLSPLSITIAPDCAIQTTAELLLYGTSLSSHGRRQPAWAVARFPAGGLAPQYLQEFQDLEIDIPDQGPAVEIEFEVDRDITGVVGAIGVAFTMEHENWYDMEVHLAHPDGATVKLLKVGSSGRGVKTKKYGSEGTDSPSENLSRLFGKPMAGKWKLRFLDARSRDTGKVLAARLQLSPPAWSACE